MRIAVIGLGVQGRKRCAVAGDLVTVTVDPALFALTTTPSMRPSALERTCPVNATGSCWARLRKLETTRRSVTAKPAATPFRRVFVRMTNRLCPEACLDVGFTGRLYSSSESALAHRELAG